jgi:hypothetical protein
MNRAALLICLGLLAGNLFAASPAAVRVENRYLFVLETSAGMKRVSKAAHEAVLDLIASGMQGNISPGDTFGIWTFNRELFTGPFPMQQWAPQNQHGITLAVAQFLEQLPYEHQPRFEAVLPALQHVIESSGWLTVILVSEARTPMAGTPFDAQINELYGRHQRDIRDARLAFVTLLTAQNGKFEGFSVNSSLGPFRFPIPPPKPAPEPPIVSTPPPAPPPPAAATNATTRAIATNATPPRLSPLTPRTNAPRPAPSGNVATAPSPVLPRPKPDAAAPVAVVTNRPPAVPAPAPRSSQEHSPAPSTSPRDVATSPRENSSASQTSAAPPTAIVATAPIQPPIPAQPPSTPSGVIETVSPPRPPASETLEVRNPKPPEIPMLPENASTNHGEQALAVAAVSGADSGRRIFWSGAAFILCAAGLVCFWIRRARERAHPSLISQSLRR